MIDNQRVNRSLADEAFDQMDHALGRHFDPSGETHRNYFATEAGGELARLFDASPWWAFDGIRWELAYYHVTAEGISALKSHLAVHCPLSAFVVSFNGYSATVTAQTAGKAKYSNWLNRSDSYPDLSFIDFARRASVRRAAA